MGQAELDRVRKIALALPGVNERLSHGAPCFFIRNKRPLCYFHDHHNDDRISLWYPAPPGVQDEMCAAEPERFFRPAPSSTGVFAGWLGVFLDPADGDPVVWTEIAVLLADAFRSLAPKALVAELDKD